ncbi:MAG: MFS transporter [Acidimicrobiia bacterium]|nr:MFS transporter [Acidimicrobiia bacterium]
MRAALVENRTRSLGIVLAAAGLAGFIALGTRASFALYLVPITTEFGWGRGTFGLAVAVQNLVWGIGQPFAGAIADRWGTGRVLVSGSLLFSGGIVLMANSSTPSGFYLSAGLVVGLGLAACSFSVILAVVGRAAPPERRTWALGIATAAGSVGNFVLIPISRLMIESFGWQSALTTSALATLVIGGLATILNGGRDSANEVNVADQTLKEALREAAAHRSYVLLVVGFFVCGFHVVFIGVHLPAHIEDIGQSANVAATALTLIGFFNVIGAFSSGILGTKGPKARLLTMLYLGRAVAITFFMVAPRSTTTTLVFAAVMGLLWLSTVPLTSGLVAQIFGLQHMGTLFGIVFLSHQLGSFMGAWLGGFLFDQTGSYNIVWWIAVALGALAALLHWPVDETPIERESRPLVKAH